MLHVTERINGMVLWANLFVLFWLSLVPFIIRWMDETHFASMPTAAYGVVLAFCRDRLHFSAASDHCVQRTQFKAGPRGRERSERESVSVALRFGHTTGLCARRGSRSSSTS